jgi:hypothetical protein
MMAGDAVQAIHRAWKRMDFVPDFMSKMSTSSKEIEPKQ